MKSNEQTYPRSIYADSLFPRAIEDYRHICVITASKKGQETICSFENSITDLELTMKEFSNYLIELSFTEE